MEKQAIETGRRVVIVGGIHKGEHGVVKYFGPVEGLFGGFYGVELDVRTLDSDSCIESCWQE